MTLYVKQCKKYYNKVQRNKVQRNMSSAQNILAELIFALNGACI